MDFTYQEAYTESLPEAYEALLLDVLQGDPTLFMRADQVEAAWKVVMPILNAWKKYPIKKLHFYEAGTWGPKAAIDLVKPYARKWFQLPRMERLSEKKNKFCSSKFQFYIAANRVTHAGEHPTFFDFVVHQHFVVTHPNRSFQTTRHTGATPACFATVRKDDAFFLSRSQYGVGVLRFDVIHPAINMNFDTSLFHIGRYGPDNGFENGEVLFSDLRWKQSLIQ